MKKQRRRRRPRNSMDDLSDTMMGATKAIIGVEVMGMTIGVLKEATK